jgi:exodeoxyribonuclease V alpha subunit
MVLNEKIDFSIFNKKKEVFFYPKMAQDGIPFILTLIDNFIKKGGNLDKDIEVLIPMYLGVAGINECNRLIQERFNPEKEKILQRDKIFLKKGDKVLLKRNNPDLDLMNGDIGKVIDIVNVDDKDKLYLDFDNKIIDYPIDEIQDLTLAYAISIHKSQGSEFDNVIVPIFKSYNIMLTKNLIYTAITRAKKKLIIIGDPKTLSYAITILSNERQTSLLEFLKDNKNDKRIRINDPEIPFEFDGEYDMEGITPYSFMDY